VTEFLRLVITEFSYHRFTHQEHSIEPYSTQLTEVNGKPREWSRRSKPSKAA
jgi:hypothetical protein